MSKMTGVFPSVDLSFSKNIETREDVKVIKINSLLHIKKKGKILTIGNKVKDISKLTIQEVVNILVVEGVDVKMVENGSRFLPALLINDFNSSRVKQIELNTNPFNLSRLLYEPYYKIQKIQLPTIKNTAVFNSGIKVPSEIINNSIYYSNGEGTILFYTLEYSEYYITISSNTINPTSSAELYRLAHLGLEK